MQVRERLEKPGSVRLHDPSASALPARRYRYRLPPCHRTSGTQRLTTQPLRRIDVAFSHCSRRPGRSRPSVPRRQTCRRADGSHAAVRKAPTDIGARVLLAELLAFSGNIERADVVLDACAELDPSAAMAVAEFRQLLRGELARRQLFSDGRVPEFLGEPTAAQRLSLAAIVALRNGDSPGGCQARRRGRGSARPSGRYCRRHGIQRHARRRRPSGLLLRGHHHNR